MFGPIREHVMSAQKTVKQTPIDTWSEAFFPMVARAHGLVEIQTRLRSDPAWHMAFGRRSGAEQSVGQETVDACTTEKVTHMQQAMDMIARPHRQGSDHDAGRAWQVLDVDLSGMPCGPNAAFATTGDVAKQRHRRGRQWGRVLATRDDEVGVDRLFAGTTHLTTALQPLVEAAETTVERDATRRARTSVRVDAGGGRLDDINWLLERDSQVQGKDSSGQRTHRLAQRVDFWCDDPPWPERPVSWVREAPEGSVRPVVRIAVRGRQQNGPWAEGVLISTLSAWQVLPLVGPPLVDLADPQALLLASVACSDQRGGGSETSFKGDKQGLGSTKRSKKRVAAQHRVILLGCVTHKVVVWARTWLATSVPPLRHYGMLRMGHDVFPLRGFLLLDASCPIVQIVLKQEAPFARFCVLSLRELLAPMHIALHLGKT